MEEFSEELDRPGKILIALPFLTKSLTFLYFSASNSCPRRAGQTGSASMRYYSNESGRIGNHGSVVQRHQRRALLQVNMLMVKQAKIPIRPILSIYNNPLPKLTCSYDTRTGNKTKAVLWSSAEELGSRAHFRAPSQPAHLLIDDLQVTDEGIYRCRVDFRDSPTRNSRINLTVIGEIYNNDNYNCLKLTKLMLLSIISL